MHITERKLLILKIWEEKIKDNKNTIRSWAKHPKSFISWSVNKCKDETYQLTQKNKKGKWFPYNLKYISIPVEPKKETPEIKEPMTSEDKHSEEIVIKTKVSTESPKEKSQEEKPKRKRRTKAQMQEARLKGEK